MTEANSITSLKKEAEINPYDDQAWLRLARFCYQQLNWQEAIAAYERVIEIRHQYATEHYDPNCILFLPSSDDNKESDNQILDQAFTY
jgi:tetratricopeptide (TPR) repeat protein